MDTIDKCKWVRAFDGHFNISCPSGERANGHWKGDIYGEQTKWQFKFCPYCGREINMIEPKKEG